jgi:hypothetical protein
MPEVRFRKWALHGEYADIMPKWHIAEEVPEVKWGVYRALCGWSFNYILDDLLVSKAKRRPPKAEICARCLKRAP